ncbi:MAG: glycosyltransferase family 2 protein [Microgenomates group bacterium]
MKTTLVICCKNESSTLASVITKAKPYVNEILVIDGHSKDDSRAIAKSNGVQVFLDNGKGKGAGVQLGIKKATGDIIVLMDADGSHKASDIPKLITPIIQGQADLVIASRGKGGSDELHGDFEKTIRMIGSAIITQIINWRYKSQITDSQNGFRAIRCSVAKNISCKENSFTIEQDMLMKSLHKHFCVNEIASHELKRKYGKSKIILKNMWSRFVWNLLQNCLTF